jgi:hypothetical protein
VAIKRRLVQATFNGGEISPPTHGRVDIERWPSSLAQCWNYIPMPEGGVTRRTGLRYVAPLKEINARRLSEEGDYRVAEDGRYRVDEDDTSISTRPALLFPFVFSDVQAYVLEAGDFYIRFFMNEGQLYGNDALQYRASEAGDRRISEAGDYRVAEDIDPSAQPYEIATPWPATSLRKLQQAQTLDVMYWACAGFQPRVLSRTGHTAWSLDPFEPRNGPFRDLNDTAITITPSGVAGGAAITLTASAATFDPGHVGALWRIEDEDQANYSTWEPGKAYAVAAQAWYAGNVYECFDSGTSGAVAPVHLEGDRFDGEAATACGWRYLHSGFGVAKITGYVSPTVVNATVQSRLPSTGATTKWREGAWSAVRGWPVSVALFEQRLWWAREQTIWGSVAGDFNDYTLGPNADDAITITINAKTANAIQTIAEGPALVALTRAREWVFEAPEGEAMSAEINFRARSYTSEGAGPAPVVLVDAALVFVGRTGQRLFALVYDFSTASFRTSELSVLARHILRPNG